MREELKIQVTGWIVVILFCCIVPVSALDWWSSGGAKPGPAGPAGAAGENVGTWSGWSTSGEILIGHSNDSAVVAPYTLPTTDGSVNQILKHNGSAALIWAEDGGGDITSHTNSTADVHGASGAVVGLTTLQSHSNSTANPHSVTYTQAGAEPANANIQSHISGTADLHGVTGAIAGATTLTNHTNATTDVHGASGATIGATTFNAHANSTANPHSVTAAQVGAEPANEHIDASTISIGSLDMSSSTSSIPWTVTTAAHDNGTTTGLAHYNSSTNIVTVGNGSAAVQMMSCHTNSLTSSQVDTAVSDDTGSGVLVFHNSPSLYAPTINNGSLIIPDIGAHANGTLTPTLDANLPAGVTTTNVGWIEIHVNGSAAYVPYWQ